MKTYKFYWKDGIVDTSKGKNAAEAFAKLGCGLNGVLAWAILDYYKEVEEEDTKVGD